MNQFESLSSTSPTAPEPFIRVESLSTYFPVKAGILRRVIDYVKAVDHVSFDIYPGETLGLVGESGSGKTTVGMTMMNLLRPTAGQVYFEGQPIFGRSAKEQKALRRKMQIVFQDPYGSLDPRLPIGESIAEGLKVNGFRNNQENFDKVLSILKKVGMEDYHAMRYPHEFSGGQRQRIGIARALVLNPSFIVLDEPVSALDVSIQAQVLNILKDLQQEFGLTYLFIAHNLGVVEHISDRVAVMYLGKIMEIAPRDELYRNCKHPYTQALLSSIPVPSPRAKRNRILLSGDIPSPLNPPSGCRFHPRCPFAQPVCAEKEPQLEQSSAGHLTACHFPLNS